MSKINSFTGEIGLNDLICENIMIPDYQRPYVWNTERVKILLEDLDEQLSYNNTNTTEKYLLGSLILYENNGEIEVVDGQQRLVSLALILRVLEKSDFLSNSKFTHNESKAHIKENYEFIKSWFETRQDKKQLFVQNLCKKVEFIYVKAPSLDDAFIFFDSANAKGKRLEGYDLIKAFHLRALEDTEPIQKYKEKLRAKNINPDDKNELIKHYARGFEDFAKQNDDKEDIKILFNETLTPARQWLRHNSNKVSYQMDIYGEFCTEIPQRFKRESTPLIAKDSLGILQNFVGGADFFEYLSHFHELYEKLRSVEFYKELEAINWANGFIYNRYIYIMAVLIYLDKFLKEGDKFPNGRVDYMLRLIARAVFALRCSESRIYIQTARDFAKEILPLIYYASFEQELEANLCSFIDEWLDKERAVEKESFNGGKTHYLEKMSSEYSTYKITPHHDKGANNE